MTLKVEIGKMKTEWVNCDIKSCCYDSHNFSYLAHDYDTKLEIEILRDIKSCNYESYNFSLS